MTGGAGARTQFGKVMPSQGRVRDTDSGCNALLRPSSVGQVLDYYSVFYRRLVEGAAGLALVCPGLALKIRFDRKKISI